MLPLFEQEGGEEKQREVLTEKVSVLPEQATELKYYILYIKAFWERGQSL